MRQFVLTPSSNRPQQLQLKSGQSSYFREVGEAHLAAVCQTLATLTSTVQQQGWILVLAPQLQLNKQVLEQCQIDCQRLLLINQKQVHRYDNLMRDALTCSTCSAVISFLPADCEQLADYQYLANKYQTQLINHCTAVAITH